MQSRKKDQVYEHLHFVKLDTPTEVNGKNDFFLQKNP